MKTNFKKKTEHKNNTPNSILAFPSSHFQLLK